MRRIYVAPHFDDVALSCGGAVAQDAEDHTVEPFVVTVCAGFPTGAASAFAAFQHERWGLSADEVVAARRSEDAQASAALGARVSVRWLDYLDAIYRDPAYDSDAALFGSVLPSDKGVVDAIAAELHALAGDEYIVPLAVGNHVDHQIALAAGRILARRGARVRGYEDLPYALKPGAVEPVVAQPFIGERKLRPLTDAAFERRWQAVACYTSQLSVLFRDWGDPRAALAAYARQVGGGELAEATWEVRRE